MVSIIFGDTEADYCERFCEYMNQKKTLPFTVQGFTDAEALKQYAKQKDVLLILVTESMAELLKGDSCEEKMAVLTSNKVHAQESDRHIYRFQAAGQIAKEIMVLLEQAKESVVSFGGTRTKIIGMYSPVKRCLQTSFSVVLGQLLARQHNVLYVNFESYSGYWGHNGIWEHSSVKEKKGCAEDSERMDLADLMYYLKNVQDKFVFRLGSSVISLGGMDYIPPAMSFTDISSVTPEQWMNFFRKIREESEYEYLLLDLSDHLQGLFDILRECDKVYTIVREEGICMAKTEQYRELLRCSGYEDILNKTSEKRIPLFREIPCKWEQLPYCELAGYVRCVMEEDFEGL